jgi:hypothetical protein
METKVILNGENMLNKSAKLNPALKNLEGLIGNWNMELSGASFLPDPQAKIKGPASFTWIENGAFVIMYQGSKKTPQATWLIGRDESKDHYKVLYFDARCVSRIYEMSFEKGKWKMWRNARGFSQRFSGIINKKSNVIEAEWEKSKDNKKWEHDFYVRYTKLK